MVIFRTLFTAFQAVLFFGLAGEATAADEEEDEAAAGEFEADASDSRPREKNDLKDRDELIIDAISHTFRKRWGVFSALCCCCCRRRRLRRRRRRRR